MLRNYKSKRAARALRDEAAKQGKHLRMPQARDLADATHDVTQSDPLQDLTHEHRHILIADHPSAPGSAHVTVNTIAAQLHTIGTVDDSPGAVFGAARRLSDPARQPVRNPRPHFIVVREADENLHNRRIIADMMGSAVYALSPFEAMQTIVKHGPTAGVYLIAATRSWSPGLVVPGVPAERTSSNHNLYAAGATFSLPPIGETAFTSAAGTDCFDFDPAADGTAPEVLRMSLRKFTGPRSRRTLSYRRDTWVQAVHAARTHFVPDPDLLSDPVAAFCAEVQSVTEYQRSPEGILGNVQVRIEINGSDLDVEQLDRVVAAITSARRTENMAVVLATVSVDLHDNDSVANFYRLIGAKAVDKSSSEGGALDPFNGPEAKRMRQEAGGDQRAEVDKQRKAKELLEELHVLRVPPKLPRPSIPDPVHPDGLESPIVFMKPEGADGVTTEDEWKVIKSATPRETFRSLLREARGSQRDSAVESAGTPMVPQYPPTEPQKLSPVEHGEAVSSADLRAGDAIIGDDHEGVYLGDQRVLTADGTVLPLSEVASFSGPNQGIFRPE